MFGPAEDPEEEGRSETGPYTQPLDKNEIDFGVWFCRAYFEARYLWEVSVD